MVIRKIKQLKIAILIILTLIMSPINVLSASAYSYYCTSEECRRAEDEYNKAIENLKTINAKIDNLEDEVAALEAENVSLSASLAVDQKMLQDLKQRIVETEEKITDLKMGIAAILIDDYFDTNNKDAVSILASSKTISDIAEKKAREETTRSQIAQYSEKIEATKEELETQKVISEQKISEQEAKQAQIEANKAAISDKLAALNGDARATNEEAERQKEIVDNAKRAAMEAQNSSGVSVYVDGYYDTYPYHYRCPGSIDAYLVVGGYVCECVSYTGWKVQEAYGIYVSSWGNALDWDTSAKNAGYRVDRNPEPGSVAVSHYGGYGHVMWVENVYENGTIDITEYNYKYGSFSARNISIYGNYGYSSNWQWDHYGYYYTKFASQPWTRGFNYMSDSLYFIHFN